MPSKESVLFENLFLRGIADAILKRRKAIRYKTDRFAMDRGVDRKEGLTFERLDLSVERHRRDYEFTFWEDSVAWIWARQVHPKKGTLFKFGFHAEVWNLPAKVVVARIESTILMDSEAAVRLLWIPADDQSPSKKITR